MKRGLILSFLLLLAFAGFSQKKEVEHQTQFWTQYNFLGRFSSRWSAYINLVGRFNNIFSSWNSVFIRPAVVYDISPAVSVYAGYSYIVYYPGDDADVKLWEKRPWQQVLVAGKLGKLSLQHRYRLEERFNAVYENGQVGRRNKFTWRFRYKLSLRYPVLKNKEDKQILSVLLSNELITSFGKNVTVSYFNQNRLFFGISVQTYKGLRASLGYTNIFKSAGKAGCYESINAPTINISHHLDFRKNR